MKGWLDFWNSAQHLYVNDRHREVHYRQTAADISALLPNPPARVLDYGPGDALSADVIATAAGQLILCEAASEIRKSLASKYSGTPRITVIEPAELADIPAHSIDLIVVNSVVQYLTGDEFDSLLAEANRLLVPTGQLLIGDVIPKTASMLSDTLALLRFAVRERFFGSAVIALAATAFSPYTWIRRRLGLSRYNEPELIAKLQAAGFSCRRHHPNLSHNQHRLTFIATRMS